MRQKSLVRFLKNIRVSILSRKFGLKVERPFSLTFGRGTLFFARDLLWLGRDVYIGRYCGIENDAVISDHAIIGNCVNFVGRTDHAIEDVGTTIRAGVSVRSPEFSVPLQKRLIYVERDVWIGCGAIILSGVQIGEGSIIGAGAVVTQSVPSNSIVVGNPAKVLRQRFSDDQFEKHKLELDARGIRNLMADRVRDEVLGHYETKQL